ESTAVEADATRPRIAISTDLDEQADREIVIEAATENEDVKKALFADLDRVVEDRNAILASNTSSIPITRLAAATERPSRVVGLHFFNPAPVMALVELITTVSTDPEVAASAQAFAEGVGPAGIRATA